MVFLSLNNGHILHTAGMAAPSPAAKFRVELSDGSLNFFSQGLFGEKRVFSAGIWTIALRVWSDVVTTGGNFVGGGFGITGAAEGMLAAGILNILTTKRRTHALLGIFIRPAGELDRDVVAGFPGMSEQDLKHRVDEAIPRWTASFVEGQLKALKTLKRTEIDAGTHYTRLVRASELGLLTRDQIQSLWSAEEANHPPKIQSPFAAAKPVARLDDRLEALKALNELRVTGALTQEEFESEKRRLLRPED